MLNLYNSKNKLLWLIGQQLKKKNLMKKSKKMLNALRDRTVCTLIISVAFSLLATHYVIRGRVLLCQLKPARNFFLVQRKLVRLC